MWIDQYLAAVESALADLRAHEAPQLSRAAAVLAEAWLRGGKLLVARTSHTLHDELVGRAAGPVAVVVADDGGATYDQEVAAIANASPGDVLLIHSNCGTTTKAVSLARCARNAGVATIGIVQLAFEASERIGSDDVHGQRLHEVCDVVIDVGGAFGDGMIERSGASSIAPLSGALAVAAAWAIIAGGAELAEHDGRRVRVLESLQLAGAAERNRALTDAWSVDGRATDALVARDANESSAT